MFDNVSVTFKPGKLSEANYKIAVKLCQTVDRATKHLTDADKMLILSQLAGVIVLKLKIMPETKPKPAKPKKKRK